MDTTLKQEIATAITSVLERLPDAQADLWDVFKRAVGGRIFGLTDIASAEFIVRQVITLLPRRWGIQRKEKFWQIVLKFLTPEQALDGYLRRVPRQLPLGTLASLRRYLAERFALSEGELSEKLAFINRPEEPKPRDPESSGAWGSGF